MSSIKNPKFPPAMESPCVKICTYEPSAGMCSGCGRTLAEVRGWFEMTDAQRRAVMVQLPQRLSQAGFSPAS
jgi:predicted Fe-S protein YdhL (DUF1289 family)